MLYLNPLQTLLVTVRGEALNCVVPL